MNILVTGATGFIGKHLVNYLLDQKLVVTVLVRESWAGGKLPGLFSKPSRQSQPIAVFADLQNYSLTARALRETSPAAVIHLAAVGVTDPFLNAQSALRHNVVGTINLLRACFEGNAIGARPTQVVVARTPGERSAMNVYAASKAAAWQFCRMYARVHSWPITGAMIFQAYGPGQPASQLIPSACRAALAGETFPMTEGYQERDWIYIEDVIAGLEAILGANLRAGATVEVGTGVATSVRRVVEMVFQSTNSSGRPEFGALPSRPGEEGRQTADASATRDLIGWRSAISLFEGLRRTCASIPA
jgi:UDP-glucose 4-epimerase